MSRCVKVRVPASTSNLGPAFDCLGLALGLYNELTLELRPGPGELVVEIEGEGAAALPRSRDNLVVRAAKSVLGNRVSGRLLFRCVNRIPLARGLGSSAAAAVAGLFAANNLLDRPPLTAQDLLEYAMVLEGHPDNAAAAVLGGLVASVRRNKQIATLPLKAHRDLRVAVCIPDFKLPTSQSRSVLPHAYLREDAVANVARAVLLGSSLERGLWDRLALAMEDRFHQPYRARLVKGLADVIKAAQKAGACGAALSGAGPAVVALGADSAVLEKAGAAMVAAFGNHGVNSRSLLLPVDRHGVRVDVYEGRISSRSSMPL